jgi:hypothetical protein
METDCNRAERGSATATALAVAAGLAARRWPPAVPVVAVVLVVIARGAIPSWGRVWDGDYFAIYTNHRRFESPEETHRRIEHVERLALAEIEPGVLGVARTFEQWNHGVLDDPRLEIVFNGGRNHFATTLDSFDVITADPLHPQARCTDRARRRPRPTRRGRSAV